MQRYLKALLVGGAAVAALAGCQRDEDVFVVAGKDVSCAECEIRGNYDPEIDRVIDWAAGGRGTVVIDVIDGNALASFAERYTGSFEPDPALGGNETLINDDLRIKARRAHGEARNALAEGGQTEGSDPLGFALAAAPLLKRHERPYLVFVSDMIQHAPAADELDLYRPPMTGREAGAEIRRLRRDKKIADLDGAKVIVVGGARSSGTDVTAKEAIAIKRFWLRYFEEAEAEVIWGPRFQVP